MSRRSCFRVPVLALLGGIFLLLALGRAGSSPHTFAGSGRPDLLRISLPAFFGPDEMPPVWFRHDLHTAGLPGKDCSVCHLQDFAAEGFDLFQGQESGPGMESFHELCLGCHEETRQEGADSGPLTGQCRQCHTRRPETRSNQQALVFGRFLHARHGEKPLEAVLDEEVRAHCGACHHDYDEQSGQTVYRPGREGSCRYCHMTPPIEDGVPSMREAAHESCVACHQRIREQPPEGAAGPVKCAGCHGRERAWQAAASTEQPDFPGKRPAILLLGAWQEAGSSVSGPPETRPRTIAPVVFRHEQHERQTATCRACHHESLEPCRQCHAQQEAPFQGQPVPLEQAMHDPGSGTSCIGCHNQMKQESDCAGCHHQMAMTGFSDSRCEACHSLASGGLSREGFQERTDSSDFGMAEARAVSEPLDIGDIPHHVQMDSLSGSYEAVSFPHLKIIRSLQERIERSSLAGSFHRGSETLCRGCHHTNFDRRQIQNCGSCHGDIARPDGKAPDLKTAYHDQCMGCHQQMGLEGFEATQCAQCHREKDNQD